VGSEPTSANLNPEVNVGMPRLWLDAHEMQRVAISLTDAGHRFERGAVCTQGKGTTEARAPAAS
jgi:ribosomal protein S12 methylthiotransferase accessory factor YcaO